MQKKTPQKYKVENIQNIQKYIVQNNKKKRVIVLHKKKAQNVKIKIFTYKENVENINTCSLHML